MHCIFGLKKIKRVIWTQRHIEFSTTLYEKKHDISNGVSMSDINKGNLTLSNLIKRANRGRSTLKSNIHIKNSNQIYVFMFF